MCRRVAFLWTNVSDDRIDSIIWLERIKELGRTLAATVLSRATQRYIPVDRILQYTSSLSILAFIAHPIANIMIQYSAGLSVVTKGISTDT
jgi:uncharacterized membrane protein YcfT